MDFENYIQVVEGFPKPGISFKDVSPLLKDAFAYSQAITALADLVKGEKIDLVIGPESRGFVFGAPLALKLNAGFVMARKKGKLPGEVVSKTYTLEYNTACIELPKFSVKKGERVLIVDDLLATGGTLKAVCDLVHEQGGEVVKALAFIELKDLDGKKNLLPYKFESILKL